MKQIASSAKNEKCFGVSWDLLCKSPIPAGPPLPPKKNPKHFFKIWLVGILFPFVAPAGLYINLFPNPDGKSLLNLT